MPESIYSMVPTYKIKLCPVFSQPILKPFVFIGGATNILILFLLLVQTVSIRTVHPVCNALYIIKLEGTIKIRGLSLCFPKLIVLDPRAIKAKQALRPNKQKRENV